MPRRRDDEELILERTRYGMSSFTYRRMQSDYILFHGAYPEKLPYPFLNRILVNYICFLQDKGMEKTKQFEQECLAVFGRRPAPKYPHKGSFAFQNQTRKKIETLGIYDQIRENQNAFASHVFACFADLPVWEREKVYFYQEYRKIRQAIKEGKSMQVSYLDTRRRESVLLDVMGVALVPDDNALGYYLVGYDRQAHTDETFECRSRRLSRILSVQTGCEAEISPAQKVELEKRLEQYGSAYMSETADRKQEPVRVRLTDFGYHQLYLRVIARQRPVPSKQPEEETGSDGKKYYLLEFDCSERQARNYFFLFGKEAEILSPLSLRNELKKAYRDALKQYEKK